MEQIKKEKSDFIKTKIKELREKIARPCTEFETKKLQDLVQSLKLKNFNMMMKIKSVG